MDHPRELKVDRVACPWLIARFIDIPGVPLRSGSDAMPWARATSAIPYDVPGFELTDVGSRCTFDSFLEKFRLDDPGLHALPAIVRGADSARPDRARMPRPAGHSLGLTASSRRTTSSTVMALSSTTPSTRSARKISAAA